MPAPACADAAQPPPIFMPPPSFAPETSSVWKSWQGLPSYVFVSFPVCLFPRVLRLGLAGARAVLGVTLLALLASTLDGADGNGVVVEVRRPATPRGCKAQDLRPQLPLRVDAARVELRSKRFWILAETMAPVRIDILMSGSSIFSNGKSEASSLPNSRLRRP